MAGQCLLAGVRKELVDVRKHDRSIEKARDGCGQKSMWGMSNEGAYPKMPAPTVLAVVDGGTRPGTGGDHRWPLLPHARFPVLVQTSVRLAMPIVRRDALRDEHGQGPNRYGGRL